MLNSQKDWFKYSSYWRTYNRVLLRKGGQFHKQIELEMTPVNPDFPEPWDEVKLAKIRIHSTGPEPFDKYSHHLNENIYAEMVKHIGEVIADFIFNYDIWDKIKGKTARRNWLLFERHVSSAGGVPLVIIDPQFDLLRKDWQKGTSSAYIDLFGEIHPYVQSELDALKKKQIREERIAGTGHHRVRLKSVLREKAPHLLWRYAWNGKFVEPETEKTWSELGARTKALILSGREKTTGNK